MEIKDLATVLDGLFDERLADGESVVALQRQFDRVEALVTMVTGAFERSEDWALDGAQTAAQWVATKTGVPIKKARHRVAMSRKLPSLPVCQDAWIAGEIGDAHVSVIARAHKARTATAVARDEAMLVHHATTNRFETFERIVDYWSQQADPDGAEDDDYDRRTRRDVYLTPSYHGMFLGKMTLDPIAGEIVGGELARRETELFDADWAEAKQRLGHEPTIFDLARTPAQRRADALVEMAIRSQTAPADGQRPAPLFTVFVGYETAHGRICELARGTVLSPGALLPWLDQAYLERAVFTLDGRVECSATERLFKGATRRAIQLRARQCEHEFCDKPGPECQVDHIIGYTKGGPTTQANGALLCGFHNRLKEKRPPPPAV